METKVIGPIVAAAGLLIVLLRIVVKGSPWFLGLIAIVVGVITYFVGVNNEKKWAAMKKELYPDGEPETANGSAEPSDGGR